MLKLFSNLYAFPLIEKRNRCQRFVCVLLLRTFTVFIMHINAFIKNMFAELENLMFSRLFAINNKTNTLNKHWFILYHRHFVHVVIFLFSYLGIIKQSLFKMCNHYKRILVTKMPSSRTFLSYQYKKIRFIILWGWSQVTT